MALSATEVSSLKPSGSKENDTPVDWVAVRRTSAYIPVEASAAGAHTSTIAKTGANVIYQLLGR
jgi:hypothetical protein